MELANIEQLVEKYLNATTTLQEEEMLRNYFLSENVAPHLQEYQPMFSYFKKSKDEVYTKPIQIKPKKTNLKWLSVAASVVLLFSVYVGNQYYQQKQAEKKFAQVKEALKLVSINLNKGNKAVATLYTYENTVHKIFNTK